MTKKQYESALEELDALLEKGITNMTMEEAKRATKLIRLMELQKQLNDETGRAKLYEEYSKDGQSFIKIEESELLYMRSVVTGSILAIPPAPIATPEDRQSRAMLEWNKVLNKYYPVLNAKKDYTAFFDKCSELYSKCEEQKSKLKLLNYRFSEYIAKYGGRRGKNSYDDNTVYELGQALVMAGLCALIALLASPLIIYGFPEITICLSIIALLIALFGIGRAIRPRLSEYLRTLHIDKVEDKLDDLNDELQKELTNFYTNPKVQDLLKSIVLGSFEHQKALEREISDLIEELDLPDDTMMYSSDKDGIYYDSVQKGELLTRWFEQENNTSDIGSSSTGKSPKKLTKAKQGV